MATADVPPPAQRVFESDDALGSVLAFLSAAERFCLRRASKRVNAIVMSPHHWRAVVCESKDPVGVAWATLPTSRLESLRFSSMLNWPTRSDFQLLCASPRLIELDLAGANVPFTALKAAFEASGGTLRRLDMSRVTCGWLAFHSGHVARPIGMIALSELADLFRPLSGLRVLVARNADAESSDRGIKFSWLLQAVAEHCPVIEELAIGWESEFKSRQTPIHKTKFTGPCTAVPAAVLSAATLRSLTLAGYAMLEPRLLHLICTAAPQLAILDVCGCGRLSDFGIATAVQPIAQSLHSLNVRGTHFGDQAAQALAAGGANLRRLNASCTALTPDGLQRISQASSRLEMLDLCYAQYLRDSDVRATVLPVVQRHAATLTMLGLGGFQLLTNQALREILMVVCVKVGGVPWSGADHGEPPLGGLTHVGIGGCPELDGLETLSSLQAFCPNLTALNAHQLSFDGVAIAEAGYDAEIEYRAVLKYLLPQFKPHHIQAQHHVRGIPGLRSLDLHGCDGLDDTFALYITEELGEEAWAAWRKLATREKEFFGDERVITVENAVRFAPPNELMRLPGAVLPLAEIANLTKIKVLGADLSKLSVKKIAAELEAQLGAQAGRDYDMAWLRGHIDNLLDGSDDD